jgi:hypothetical protein
MAVREKSLRSDLVHAPGRQTPLSESSSVVEFTQLCQSGKRER